MIGIALVLVGVDSVLLASIVLLAEWWSPVMSLTLWPAIVFLAGISATVAGAGLLRWAAIRDADRYWLP